MHIRIEAYLNGTMSPEDMQRMSQEILQDPSLAEEVELHRSLQAMLEDKAYLDFRRHLDEVTNQSGTSPDDPTGSKPFNWLIWVAIGFTVLVLIWVFAPWPASTPIEPAPPLHTQEDQKHELQLQDPSDLSVSEPSQPADTEEVTPVNPPDPYAPLPRLEQAMQQPADPVFEVVEAMAELLPAPGSVEWQVQFRGQLLTAQEPPAFQLHIINNQGERIIQLPVRLQLVEDDAPVRAFARKNTYLLSANETLRMLPGLYYTRLYRLDTATYLWTSRTEVR